MAAGDYIKHGTGTLSASAPGVIASADITATGAAATSVVMITLNSKVERDLHLGGNGIYVSSVTTNSFTVKSFYPELKEDVEFTFIVFAGA